MSCITTRGERRETGNLVEEIALEGVEALLKVAERARRAHRPAVRKDGAGYL
jgi:hypothetical protein